MASVTHALPAHIMQEYTKTIAAIYALFAGNQLEASRALHAVASARRNELLAELGACMDADICIELGKQIADETRALNQMRAQDATHKSHVNFMKHLASAASHLISAVLGEPSNDVRDMYTLSCWFAQAHVSLGVAPFADSIGQAPQRATGKKRARAAAPSSHSASDDSDREASRPRTNAADSARAPPATARRPRKAPAPALAPAPAPALASASALVQVPAAECGGGDRHRGREGQQVWPRVS